MQCIKFVRVCISNSILGLEYSSEGVKIDLDAKDTGWVTPGKITIRNRTHLLVEGQTGTQLLYISASLENPEVDLPGV